MRFDLKQRFVIIGVFIFLGAFLGVPSREAILSNRSSNPNDFTAVFLTIIQTSALIDLLASIPIFGLLVIALATRR